MSKIRASLTAFMISAVGAGGVVLSAAPAGAGITPGDETTLNCTSGTSGSGDPIETCTVSDTDGIRTLLVRNTETNAQHTAVGFDCADAPESFTFNVPAGSRYRVFVTDCDSPRNRTTFVIRPNGDVNRVDPAPAA